MEVGQVALVKEKMSVAGLSLILAEYGILKVKLIPS